MTDTPDATPPPSTIGELDLHLAAEGTHRRLFEVLGAHERAIGGVRGVAFAVWAPNARRVAVVGDFNAWDGGTHPMRPLESSGLWETFVPGVSDGALYKYEILTREGEALLKSDPYAFATEPGGNRASLVFSSQHEWQDSAWMEARRRHDAHKRPLSIYELHLGSWRRTAEGDLLGYREVVEQLVPYLLDMGFTHVELLPIAEHPYSGSWGYQVTGYFAPTARYGNPDDFRHFVDELHQAGVGVIVDWVPAHFPRDAWALARFDGTALYEHADPRRGEHPDWGTLIFDFGRREVRNFLISNALFWLEEFHIDGLRVDAVASMLYLDYSRRDGEWAPNELGGRENIEAIDLLKQLNTAVHEEHADVLMIAEESTAFPGVSRPVRLGGLGFDFKWNMGWMHDTLLYFSKDPIHRRYHHNQLTFSLMYAWTESYVLPISHDEVVHGKGSLFGKMAGDAHSKLANLRACLAYMWAHPGKQLLFMGCELAQQREWSHDRELDWGLLDDDAHRGVQRLVSALNHTYRNTPALWEMDEAPDSFTWIDANDADNNTISFYRTGASKGAWLVCVCNLSGVPLDAYRIGLPGPGNFAEVLNTDSALYGGTNTGNLGGVTAEAVPWHGLDYSARLTLPALTALWLRH